MTPSVPVAFRKTGAKGGSATTAGDGAVTVATTGLITGAAAITWLGSAAAGGALAAFAAAYSARAVSAENKGFFARAASLNAPVMKGTMGAILSVRASIIRLFRHSNGRKRCTLRAFSASICL